MSKAQAIVDQLVGLNLEKVQEICGKHKVILRIIKMDGEDLIGTADLRMDRINVDVENKIVIEAYAG
jgi:hypothetical protein